MTLKIGLIGCGVMGEDHARFLVNDAPGAELAALFDPSADRLAVVRALAPAARVFSDPKDMIADATIDAVIVASPDDTHAPLSLAAIRAGKPALVEKPLASSLEAARAVIEAEVAAGRRLVQVGLMRRFDPGYAALAETVRSGALGAPIFLHCVHRNAVAPDYVTSDLVVSNSSVHEFDVTRFLLNEEFAFISVTKARKSSRSETRQPLLIMLESVSGVVVTLEAFLDAQYGYEVMAELVCEEGTRSLNRTPRVANRHSGALSFDMDPDWRGHFADAYRLQMQSFVRFAAGGPPAGASAFDGFVASLTASFGLRALKEGGRVAIDIGAKPALYA